MLVSDHRTHLGTLSLHVMLKESLDDILVVNMHKQPGWGHFVGLWQCCSCNGPVDMANLCLTDGAEQPVEAAGAVSCYQVAKRTQQKAKLEKNPSKNLPFLEVVLLLPFQCNCYHLFIGFTIVYAFYLDILISLKLTDFVLNWRLSVPFFFFFRLSSAVFAVILSGLKLLTEWLISLLQCLRHR